MAIQKIIVYNALFKTILDLGHTHFFLSLLRFEFLFHRLSKENSYSTKRKCSQLVNFPNTV